MSLHIVDYNCGNPASVQRMIEKVGGSAEIINKPDELRKASKVILPGVGAFDHGMRNLQESGLLDVLNELVLEKKVPVLGICLGMQLLCNRSEEGLLPGLRWIDADVKRFRLEVNSNLKIPHMGWNIVKPVRESKLFSMQSEEQRYYHVHSFHAVCNNQNDIAAVSHHGYDFTTAVERDNIMGVQFHPEKSHRFGMGLLKRFVEIPS